MTDAAKYVTEEAVSALASGMPLRLSPRALLEAVAPLIVAAAEPDIRADEREAMTPVVNGIVAQAQREARAAVVAEAAEGRGPAVPAALQWANNTARGATPEISAYLTPLVTAIIADQTETEVRA